MTIYLIAASCLAAAALNALILNALLRGEYKKYPILFFYATILFATNVIDCTIYFDQGGWSGGLGNKIAWTNQAIRQAFLFVLVISFVYRAMSIGRKRAAIRRMLVGGSVLFAAGCILVLRNPRLSVWMTDVIGRLSFGAAVLTLLLWAVLIQQRSRDRQLLMLTGGLGLQITGEALGQSMRTLHSVSIFLGMAGNFMLVLAHLMCLYVWWHALRPVPSPPGPPIASPPRKQTNKQTTNQTSGVPAYRSL